MIFTELVPTADILLALQPQELGGYVIEYFRADGDPWRFSAHRANFTTNDIVRDYAPEKRDECKKALMEAWVYLEREGPIAPAASPARQCPN